MSTNSSLPPETAVGVSLFCLFCAFKSHLPNTLKPFGMSGGDDGARTRDLSRDRTMKNGNPLILQRTDGSESAQKHLKRGFSTLIEP